MAIRVTIIKKGEVPLETDVEEDYTFEDLIDALADAWDVPKEDYVLMMGNDIFEGNTRFSDAGAKHDDVYELIHRNEIQSSQSVQSTISGDIAPALQWLYDNIGLDPDNMEIVSDDKAQPLREIEFKYNLDDRIYKVKMDTDTGKVKKYSPPK